jgi:hypothetical protein
MAVVLGCFVTLSVVPRPKTARPPDSWTTDEGDRRLNDFYYRRFDAKREIARDLIAGRRSLLEAAALFGELNRMPPEALSLDWQDSAPFPLGAPVRTDDERLCLKVANWVRGTISNNPALLEEVLVRLEAEYRAEQTKHGTVKLPDPATLPPIR